MQQTQGGKWTKNLSFFIQKNDDNVDISCKYFNLEIDPLGLTKRYTSSSSSAVSSISLYQQVLDLQKYFSLNLNVLKIGSIISVLGHFIKRKFYRKTFHGQDISQKDISQKYISQTKHFIDRTFYRKKKHFSQIRNIFFLPINLSDFYFTYYSYFCC